MIPQIPYAAIGIGVAVLFGIWAFVAADSFRARVLIAGAAVAVFLIGAIVPTRVGRLVALVGWVVFGIGCIIYLKLKGLEIR